MLKRIHITINGHVQGIFFRSFIKENASNLNLKGYVKNLPSGEVEAVFEGQKECIDKMMIICKKGHKLASVDNIEIKEERPTKEFEGFTIAR